MEAKTTYKAKCIKCFREKTYSLRLGTIIELSEKDIQSWQTRGYITRSNFVYDPVILGPKNIQVFKVIETYLPIEPKIK